MGISFGTERWNKVKETYDAWWDRKLERPVVPVILEGKDPGRKEPGVPLLTQSVCNDLSIPAKDLIDRIDYELSKNEYLGDAFPFFNMDCFGPGVVAAFLGANLDNSSGRVWFSPKEILPIEELHFEYDPDNIWLNRIKEIYAEGMKRWQGEVLMGMPDLGGVLDILATFRSTDHLLMDLYDSPEEVKRLSLEIEGLWHRIYNEFNSILQPVNPGYSDWSRLYSSKPTYVLQSDFSYMISPAMFEEFSRPELERTCKKLARSIYHLDGVGQLPHMDFLLSIKELDAVQWIPGDGKPGPQDWPEVQMKIRDAGKNIQLTCGPDGLDKVVGYLGTGKGIHIWPVTGRLQDKDGYKRMLELYGIG